MDITITYSDIKQLEKLGDVSKYSPSFTFIDSTGKKKRDAWKVKSHYAAKLDPFAIIMEGNKPIRAFYTEAEDVIDSLIKYLDENGKQISKNC